LPKVQDVIKLNVTAKVMAHSLQQSFSKRKIRFKKGGGKTK